MLNRVDIRMASDWVILHPETHRVGHLLWSPALQEHSVKLTFAPTPFDLGSCDAWHRVGGRERAEVVALTEGGGRDALATTDHAHLLQPSTPPGVSGRERLFHQPRRSIRTTGPWNPLTDAWLVFLLPVCFPTVCKTVRPSGESSSISTYISRRLTEGRCHLQKC